MPNYIRYSPTSQTQSLKKGNFYIGGGDASKGPTSTTGFYNGINPPAGGYTIYFNKVSGGPAVYVATNDAELISLTNSVANTSYTTAAECISYYQGQSDKMMVNKYYPPIITDSLVLDLDPSFIPSYGGSGTNYYDISQGANNATLSNGPTFSSNGYFTMDGTDDNIIVDGNIMSSNNGTVVIWVRTTDTTWLWARGNDNNSYYLGASNNGSTLYQENCGVPSYSIDASAFSGNPSADGYFNGKFHMFEAKGVNWSGWTKHDFLYYPGFGMIGGVAKILVYDKLLTQSESLQNLHQAPIITSNLQYSWDAGNLVCYVNGETSVVSLPNSLSDSGTLVNGVGFTTGSGGGWVFDGTNDVINTSNTNPVGDITVECWYNGTKSTRNHLWDFGSQGSNTNLNFNFNDSGYDLWVYWNGGGTNRVRYNISGSFTDGTNKCLTFTHTGSTNKVYLNGTELTITESGGTQTFNNVNSGSYFRFGGDVQFAGNIYCVRIYNTALTALQIEQNFNAQKARYGL